MEDYLQKALDDKMAFDAYANPEEARKIVENRIGFMRDIFGENMDKVIDDLVNYVRKQGVVYYGDFEMTIFTWEMKNLGKYLGEHIKRFKEEMESLKSPECKHITGNSGKCINCGK